MKEGFTSTLDTSGYSIRVEATLHLPDASTMLSCSRLKYDEGHYYLQTEGKNQTIWVFDSVGNFVSRLGERGRRSNEYQTDITDWFHASGADEVYVFEKNARKMHVFSTDGTQSEAFTLKSWPNAVGVLEKGKLFCSYYQQQAKDGLQLALLDENEDVLSRFVFLGDDMEFVPSDLSFYKVGDRLFHVPSFADSALVFCADTVERVVRLRFDDDFIPADVKKDALRDDLEGYHAFKGVKYVEAYYETSRYHVIRFLYANLFLTQLVDKQDGRQFRFTSALPKGLFPSTVFCVRGDKMYYVITKENVEEISALLDKDTYKDGLQQSSKVIQDIFNGKVQLPVIVSIEIK